jgi:hypothetical protein
MMRTPLTLFLGLGLLAGPALASTDHAGCYKRAYDAAHLARDPKQQVTAIAVSVTAGTADTPATADVNASLRGSKAQWNAGGPCKPQGESLLCDFSDTGGTALLTWRQDGLRLEAASTGGLGLEGIGLGGDGGERIIKTLSKAHDGVFLLEAAPASACQ